MGQNLSAQHSHLLLPENSSVLYALPLKSSQTFIHTITNQSSPSSTSITLRIDLYCVSDEDYLHSFSTKGFYVRSCANLYRKKLENNVGGSQDNHQELLVAQYCHVYGPCSGRNKVYRKEVDGGEVVIQAIKGVDLISIAKDDLVNLIKD